MIKLLLITDSTGFPFYSKYFDKKYIQFESTLLSGLISAIGTVGKTLFNEEIATISFGENEANNKIIIVSKELISIGKVIYFVFIVQGNYNFKLMSQLATHIFIETKNVLKNNINLKQDLAPIIDNILQKNSFFAQINI